MRILKSKVARAAALQKKNYKVPESLNKPVPELDVQNQRVDRPKRTRTPVTKFAGSLLAAPKKLTSCNNIMKNYSQVLTKFAVSDISIPYLKPILAGTNIEVEQFRSFINTKREKANCIKGLRELLLVEETDSEEMVCFKDAFKQISVIFLKFFCVNWVFNSRISDKIVHLKYRFKILRRVKNPIHFTYLEGFAA